MGPKYLLRPIILWQVSGIILPTCALPVIGHLAFTFQAKQRKTTYLVHCLSKKSATLGIESCCDFLFIYGAG